MAKKKHRKKTAKKSRATKRSSSGTPSRQTSQDSGFASLDRDLSQGLEGGADQGQTTGRMIMTLLDEGPQAAKQAVKAMSNMTGMSASRMMHSSDFGSEEMPVDILNDANFIVLDKVGVVILNGNQEENAMASAATPQDDNVVVEPEYWNVPLGFESSATDFGDETSPIDDLGVGAGSSMSQEFLLGARRVLDLLIEHQSGGNSMSRTLNTGRCFSDNTSFTWGLQATNVSSSPLSGRGVKVAVLDSGFDASHPDFAGRVIQRATFIPRNEPDNDTNDRNGHGTHCIGTACGTRNPGVGPRYGVAHGAEIFSGKVLRQRGGGASGADGWILSGMNWALQNRCEIISMSLGSRAFNSQFPIMYERAAQRGLRAGTLILAATGNDSNRRFGQMDAVGRPANCPSIASVAAVDSCLGIARFSNGQRFGNGGEVNFSGPGVNVLSSVPMPRRRASFNGTSMATPHAAGIAALIVEQTGKTGIELYREMRNRAQQIGNRRDFGNGLVRI